MSKEIPIVILAGGQSTRMGQDKGLLSLNNQAMIDYIISVSKEMSNQIYISTNNLAYQKFGLPLIQDSYLDCGPLGGIHSALKNINTQKIIVLSCDIPYIKKEVLNRLIENHHTQISIAQHGEKIHPLIGIYEQSCLPIIDKQLKQKDYKVQHLFEICSVNFVKMDDLDVNLFRNINSPTDL